MSPQMTQSLTRMSERTWDSKKSNFSVMWPDQHDDIVHMRALKPLTGFNILERLSGRGEALIGQLPRQSLEIKLAPNKPCLIGFLEILTLSTRCSWSTLKSQDLVCFFEWGCKPFVFTQNMNDVWLALSKRDAYRLSNAYHSKRFPLHNAPNHSLNNAASHIGQY